MDGPPMVKLEFSCSIDESASSRDKRRELERKIRKERREREEQLIISREEQARGEAGKIKKKKEKRTTRTRRMTRTRKMKMMKKIFVIRKKDNEEELRTRMMTSKKMMMAAVEHPKVKSVLLPVVESYHPKIMRVVKIVLSFLMDNIQIHPRQVLLVVVHQVVVVAMMHLYDHC